MGQRGAVEGRAAANGVESRGRGTESARIGGEVGGAIWQFGRGGRWGRTGNQADGRVSKDRRNGADRDETGKRPVRELEEFNLSAVDLAAREHAGDHFVEADEMVRDEETRKLCPQIW